ncbi:MAG: response regulator, partial [Nostoc sp.]
MPIQVLLVEDNPGDAQLTRIALENSKISIDLNVVEDGVEAMAFLRKQEKYVKAAHPDIIL